MGHDHYCSTCGRDVDQDFSCLHQRPIFKIEVMIIYMMVILLPILMIPKEVLLERLTWESLLPTTALSFVIILIFLTLMNILLNRPYLALFFGCHQRKNRSPIVFHRAWVLCTRCTGIYFGMMFMIISYVFIFDVWVYILSAIPLIIDGILQQKNIIKSTGRRRFITGCLFGLSLVFIINIIVYGMMLFSYWIVEII